MMNSVKASTPKALKGSFLSAALAALLTPMYAVAAGSPDSPSEITFLTWGDYIDEEIVSKFETEYNAKVNFVYFESDDTRDEILTTYGAEGYDLILVDSVNIPFYKKLGWITDFDKKIAPNLNSVKLPTLSNLEKRDHTCTPYAWGTTGIAYRKDLVPEPITSWQQIYDPTSKLQGKILMSSLGEEVIGMALKSLGYSMTSSDMKELEEARQLLLAQAPSVAGYSAVVVDSEESKLVTGEITVLLTYSGDALMLKDIEPQIEYVVPEEGGAIWADFVCLSAKGNNPELAHRFTNFINRPEQAAQNALYFYSATPNKEAEKLLPEEFLNNPIIYPNKKTVALSETYQPLSLRTKKKHSSIMNELRGTLE